ncbi:hypothetical protein RhiirA4_181039 [Rhizophagus irregularis]|uniref:Uncharacterized protein n=1 Tax=Rhizophagus irregularis TaxID=588596 RepID=A0A2I1HNQ9_9GLOM|nr:hypothetical protein RhiirA4_181039 [Rhizophagus irregularis]
MLFKRIIISKAFFILIRKVIHKQIRFFVNNRNLFIINEFFVTIFFWCLKI